MFAATYARMRLAKTQIIESLDSLGGQVSALFPSKKIYDIPGFAGITGAELISRLEEQVDHFSPDIFLGEAVKGFDKTDLGFRIETTRRTTYSRAIIIAAGVGAFEPRRLAVDNASEFEGKEVRYFVRNPAEFAGKTVAIAGGGDSAVDWALELEKVADEVHIIHRRDQFRAMEGSVEALRQSSVNIHTPYTVTALERLSDGKLGVTLKKAKSDEEERIAVDNMIVKENITVDDDVRAELAKQFPEATAEQLAQLKTYGHYINSNKGVVRGLQANATVSLTDDLSLIVNYAYTNGIVHNE